jgi:hypothetical protein
MLTTPTPSSTQTSRSFQVRSPSLRSPLQLLNPYNCRQNTNQKSLSSTHLPGLRDRYTSYKSFTRTRTIVVSPYLGINRTASRSSCTNPGSYHQKPTGRAIERFIAGKEARRDYHGGTAEIADAVQGYGPWRWWCRKDGVDGAGSFSRFLLKIRHHG